LPAKVLRISLEEATLKLRSVLRVRGPEIVPTQAALGRPLAEDLVASWPLPRFDVSHMDGYAVRSVDLAGASEDSPVTLRVMGISRPDGLGPTTFQPHTCVRVLTGGRLPEGADSVVAQEATERVGDDVKFVGEVSEMEHVHHAGSDVREGTELFRRGHTLNSRDISFLLAYGLPSVRVGPRLKVGVLATGSELVESRNGPVAGKVMESNRLVIMEAVSASGFLAEDLGLAKDDPEEIASFLRRGIGDCDVILTTGGSSVSEADLVPEALRLLGGEVVFHGLLLRPSRTLGAFVVGGKPVFLLSGLIQAGVSAFFNVVYPALRYIGGSGWERLPAVQAHITEEVSRAEGPFRYVTWVRLSADVGVLSAHPARSASTTRFVLTTVNGFMVTEPGQSVAKGDMVEVYLPYGFGLEDALGRR
jgi:molybdenum cofactor synthesis domain-containing protein